MSESRNSVNNRRTMMRNYLAIAAIGPVSSLSAACFATRGITCCAAQSG